MQLLAGVDQPDLAGVPGRRAVVGEQRVEVEVQRVGLGGVRVEEQSSALGVHHAVPAPHDPQQLALLRRQRPQQGAVHGGPVRAEDLVGHLGHGAWPAGRRGEQCGDPLGRHTPVEEPVREPQRVGHRAVHGPVRPRLVGVQAHYDGARATGIRLR